MSFLPNTSLGTVGMIAGAILTVVGLAAYATGNSTLNLVGFFYGIPILLGGLALKAAELKPVPYNPPTPEAILALRQQQATSTQNQIRQDVTRYRYGQEAHLDSSLASLGFAPTDEERPLLLSIREEVIDNAYALILQFYSPAFPLEKWQEKQGKIERFFGPGLRVALHQLPDDRIEVALIATPT